MLNICCLVFYGSCMESFSRDKCIDNRMDQLLNSETKFIFQNLFSRVTLAMNGIALFAVVSTA